MSYSISSKHAISQSNRVQVNFVTLLQRSRQCSFQINSPQTLPQTYLKAIRIAKKIISLLEKEYTGIASLQDCRSLKDKCNEVRNTPLFLGVIVFDLLEEPSLIAKCRDAYIVLEGMLASREDSALSRLLSRVWEKEFSYLPPDYWF